MASSTVICAKSQPPKARKRIVVDLPLGSAAELNEQSAMASSGNARDQCEKDCGLVNVDEDNCVNESNKDSQIMLGKPALSAKDAPVAINNEVKGINATRKRRGAGDVVELVCKSRAKIKKEKNPNEPKRPPTAFFLFMDEFRQTYKKDNPNVKGGSAPVTKEGSEKWRAMSAEAKEPYIKKSAVMKEEYQKALKIYNSVAKESVESTITDNADAKPDGVDESYEETAASTHQTGET